ncbi:putative ribonuclease H-like domain-containing protein [Tanacetum coccineum]
MTQTVPSKSTANVFYQGTARPRVPQAVLFTKSNLTRNPLQPQRPKKIVKSIWVKKESTVGSQAVLPQNVSVKGSAMINPTQTWRPKGAYLDSVNRDNGSYTLKQFEYGNPEEDLKDYAIIDSGCSGSMTGDKDKLSDFKEFKVTCLVAKATKDEAVLWHRRLGHVNFKNINKLVKGNLVRGLPSKTFKLDHSCLACRKGKQHRASCKKIEERTVREPLELLHIDLFGPVSVESVNRKKYCLVVTDDCSRFSWVFFLAYKDETYDMLHDLIVGLENKLRHKVKTIRCDHGTEFKNHLMNEFCAKKGIKREYSIARTPQQNGVAERKNRTLIEAARTMLADSLLPIQFWAEAVNTACYVLNRVLVTKPQMKTPYEILMGRSPNISFMRPFGCPLTILNTLDQLGKFDGKSEEGYLLGYSTSSKGFRVYNRVTRKVQDCLHVDFLEDQENQKGKGPDWMFDLELLTPSMNYIPVRKENYADSGGKVSTYDDVEDLDDQQFIVHGPSINAAQNKHSEERTADKEVPLSSEEQALHDELVSLMHQESIAKVHNDAQRNAFEEEKRRITLEKGKESANSTLTLSTANTPSQSTGNTPTGFFDAGQHSLPSSDLNLPHTSGMETFPDDDHMKHLSDSDDDVPKDGVFSTNSFDDENTDNEEDGAPDYNNMDHTIDVSSTPTLRIHKNHPQSQIIGKSTAGVLTRRKLKESASVQHQALLSFIYKQNRTNHKDQQTCLFACFLSQEEPKKVSQALADESWVEAMQEELLQFKLQEVWVLCDLPEGKRVIGTKWVFRNKRDERGTIIKNKARLVAQGYRQEEGVDYDEVFAPVARIEAIRLFLAFASFMGFTVYQMDVKSAFLYGNITEEPQEHGMKDSPFHLEAFSDSDYAGDNHDRRSTSGGCQYLGRRLVSWQCKKQTIVAISSTEAEYVAAASCCAQVLWMQNQLLDYGFNFMNTEIHIDNESTICIVKNPVFHSKTKHIQIRHHFIRDCYEQRLINVVKVHTDDNVADLLTKGFDLARFNFLVVLWMQNQLLDYGFNFMNTEIHIDNESTICIVKNPVLHSKTKHIQIRHHFIRDCYEQRLINVVKVHTDDNVADLLTKGFDLARFNFLVVTIESLEALLLCLRGGYE